MGEMRSAKDPRLFGLISELCTVGEASSIETAECAKRGVNIQRHAIQMTDVSL